jgi:hypothetical protein
VIARVVTKRDDAHLAMIATLVAGLFLALILADDYLRIRLVPGPNPPIYLLIAAAMVLGGIGPWLAWSRRGRVTAVHCADGVVRAGQLAITSDDATAVSVAQGARGQSVAVAHGTKLTFFEVERTEDAARIVETLGAAPPLAEAALRHPSRALAVPQAIVTFAALLCAPLYYLAALHPLSTFIAFDSKLFYGLGGVIAAELSLVLLAVRTLVPNHAVALRRGGAWDAHAAIHRAQQQEEEDPRARADAPARVANLTRGDEQVGAWLARLDALPTEQHAYRGDAMKKDVLWETLGDDGAPVDARMGAARVLCRRYGEEEVALVRVVQDPEVRVRVAAALEEQEDAERRLETLGPLFRAR